ncbi:MAG TPA: N-acetylmuramoyl-L-alanine amidase [Actinomycetota bacterium]|nr:N-acetylmuramoyl-L-alanine amidase [Actinomycetota bacterium]
MSAVVISPGRRAALVLLVPVLAAAVACSGAPQRRAAASPAPSPAPTPAPTPAPRVTAPPATPVPAKPAAAPTTAKPAAAPTTAKPAPRPGAPSPSPPLAAGASGLAGRTVVIDPGHNGQNWAHTAEINRLVDIGNGTKACDTTGTATRDGYSEAAYNLDVAQRLASLLTAAGARVVLTRSDNNGWGPCIDERAAIGNDAHADVAISIHADGSTVGRGFHVIYPVSLPGLTDAIAAPSERLAIDIRDAYAAGTGVPSSTYIGRDGLDQRSDLGGLNLSRVPKVFIETGNMDNAADAALLEDPGFRQRAAQSLLAGLEAYLR